MVQWIKDLTLSLQQLGSLLWYEFNSWPGNFRVPWAEEKKKKRVWKVLNFIHTLYVLDERLQVQRGEVSCHQRQI